MKITDLSITLHTWDVPPVNYTGTAAGGKKEVGVVTIGTDEGVEGHSFLGTSNQGADEFLHEVIGRLKPVVIGRDPLDVGAIWQELWKRNRLVDSKSICAVDVALWDIGRRARALVARHWARLPCSRWSHSRVNPTMRRPQARRRSCRVRVRCPQHCTVGRVMAGGGDVTAGDVARWMADQIAEHGLLDQAAAAERIGRTFGTAFAAENGNGTWAISRPVLAAFRKLTGDAVVWERSSQLWRHRVPGDPPGRRQVD